MINWIHGDIFDSDCEALVNPVNCIGVMGAGLASQFKKHFPGNFQAYFEECGRQAIVPGKLFVWPDNGKIIINFPTKDHWKNPSKLKFIEKGLDTLEKQDYESIAIPPLGCGLGGLRWMDVKRLIHVKLKDYPGTIDVYCPMEDI